MVKIWLRSEDGKKEQINADNEIGTKYPVGKNNVDKDS